MFFCQHVFMICVKIWVIRFQSSLEYGSHYGALNYRASYITNGGGLSFNFGCVH